MKPLLIFLTALLSSSQTFAQGSLTPPPGPPVASMKTLDQVEPRIDLATVASDANNRFVISQPGCYFLTANINATGTNGIIIHVDDVSIDLGGFSLIGDASANHTGILTSQSLKNIRIRNGTIRGFSSNGIFLSESRDACFEDLTVSGNAFTGIYTGHEAVLTRCNVRDNGAYGIRAGERSMVSQCVVTGSGHNGINVGHNSQVRECVAVENEASGIYMVENGLVIGCTADANGLDGVGGGDRVICRDCTSRGNGGRGVLLDQAALVTGCVVSLNQQSGIEIHDGVVKDCSAYQNHLHGILITFGIVRDNQCVSNGIGAGITNGAGISAGLGCRVEANVCQSNDIGIASPGVVVGNLSSGNSGIGTPSAHYHTGGSSLNLGPVGIASTTTSPTANFSNP